MLFQMITLKEKYDGTIDFGDMETKLAYYSVEKYANKLKIGCFAAASNVTGLVSDVDKLSTMMHKYNGLVFFDYATAAPYVEINMNPVVENIEYEQHTQI